ncbi:MAG: tRNA lysidine(34) synthetase TilS [Rothia sp. (in: high G+C Gram-positive bacteria)]|nr:tRNA lysidine(34) synthetase TilS [Rothia sp. (in: high G+C Gram-positive bacteria)]
MQAERKSRLNPVVGQARGELASALTAAFGEGAVAATGRAGRRTAAHQNRQVPLVLVAVSGGPDSLALASLTAHFARRGDIRAGAVVVDHQLQTGSAEVAARTVALLEDMGLAPVLSEKVTVDTGTEGPEMAARTARYTAFEKAVSATGAAAVLLGHTLDDQAETVLLGLARGSGTRSLAGMPTIKVENGVTYLRPLLGTRRTTIEEICAEQGLDPWHDPTNHDQSLMRAKVRHSVLPYLEENLGPGVAVALARTAAITGPDSEYMEAQAATALSEVRLSPVEAGGLDCLNLPENAGGAGGEPVILNRADLLALHPALRGRVLALAVKQAGGLNPGFERLGALEEFVKEHSIAGPLQLPGHVSAYRRRPSARWWQQEKQINLKKTGVLVLLSTAK